MALTLKDIEERLKNKGAPGSEPCVRGDHSLNKDMVPAKQLRRAAVLLLLIVRDDGLHVLFTERTAHLSTHAGQISFPGGGADATDIDMTDTALREAEEEIGLDRANVRVIGQMEDYTTRSGFLITPVVAVLENMQDWRPSEDEVAAIFEAPLDHILFSGSLKEESISFEGQERKFYALEWREFRIWGATAGILKNFSNIVLGQKPDDNGSNVLCRKSWKNGGN